MFTKTRTVATLLVLAGSLALFGATGAHATEAPHADSVARNDLIKVATGLKSGNAPRDTESVPRGSEITYHLQDGSSLTFTYDQEGSVILPTVPTGGAHSTGGALPMADAGADPFPSIELDSAEQGAAAAGTASTLAGAICVALGTETAGVDCVVGAEVGATLVAIAASHGVCPDSKTLRIYVLTGESQCRQSNELDSDRQEGETK